MNTSTIFRRIGSTILLAACLAFGAHSIAEAKGGGFSSGGGRSFSSGSRSFSSPSRSFSTPSHSSPSSKGFSTPSISKPAYKAPTPAVTSPKGFATPRTPTTPQSALSTGARPIPGQVTSRGDYSRWNGSSRVVEHYHYGSPGFGGGMGGGSFWFWMWAMDRSHYMGPGYYGAGGTMVAAGTPGATYVAGPPDTSGAWLVILLNCLIFGSILGLIIWWCVVANRRGYWFYY